MALATALSPDVPAPRRSAFAWCALLLGLWNCLPAILPLGTLTIQTAGLPQTIWLAFAVGVTLAACWMFGGRIWQRFAWFIVPLVVWIGVPEAWYYIMESRTLLILKASHPLILVWLSGLITLILLTERLLRHTYDHFQQQQALYRQLTALLSQSVDEGVAVFTPQGQLRWANKAALPLIAPLRPEVAKLLQRTQTTQHVASQSMTLSETRRLILQMKTLPDASIQLIARPISSETDAQSSFYERFLRRIVHDMRNPLAAIIAHSANLHVYSQPEIIQTATIIESEAQRLTRLVDSLLFDARLSYVPLALERLDLLDVLEEVFYQFDERAEQEGKTLEIETAMTSAPLEADRDLLVRALGNLVDNSLKYTSEGAIVRLLLDKSPKHYFVRVSDTGSGIPPEYLPHRIFEPLVRVRPGGGALGSGLGLSIVQKIVELHHATISVESTLGEGTTFTLCLSYASDL